jgi:hypothetical protein
LVFRFVGDLKQANAVDALCDRHPASLCLINQTFEIVTVLPPEFLIGDALSAQVCFDEKLNRMEVEEVDWCLVMPASRRASAL